MSLTTILPLISAVLVFYLGFLVFKNGKTEKVNMTFALFALAITGWMFGTFMMFLNKDNTAQIIFWDKFVYISVVFIPAIMLHFGLALTHDAGKKGKVLLSAGYMLSAIFLFLIPTRFFVDGAFIYEWGAHARAQFFHHIFLLYFFIYMILWFALVIRYYGTITSSMEKERIKYSLAAFTILFTMGSLGYLPAYGVSIYPFAYVSGVFFTIILAYAIVVHRLMDIKLVMRRSTVFIFSIASIAIPAFFIKFALYKIFNTTSNMVDIIILILSISLFPPIKDYYYKLANKYFFSSLYDTKTVIEDISDQLSSTLEIKNIYGYISDILLNTMHIKSIGILTYSPQKKEYVLQFNVGIDTGRQKNFKDDASLQKDFADQSNPIVVEELKSQSYEKYKNTIDLMDSLGIEVLVPLDVKSKPIGLMVLGAKESGDMYNEDDLGVLKIVGSQMAISLENALLYEKTRNFNRKLKQEVEVATADLMAANEQLKKLDAAKSEFISIASHQLRTPLTAIKGYISMMLEGDFGTLTEPEMQSLEKVFDSNERLIKLVENLLNVSRIESGRLQFNFEEVQLEKMVGSVMDELSGHAKKKDLKVEYIKPDRPLPKVNIDDEKIRQVVMNLIDNSIKYTKQGNVTVKLEQEGNDIKFSVSDSGMGISATDMPNMFKKFSRGTGTSLIHTEGTGLGLFVAKQMMEAHHGQIWAESKGEGLGSKFCFKLPIIQEQIPSPSQGEG